MKPANEIQWVYPPTRESIQLSRTQALTHLLRELPDRNFFAFFAFAFRRDLSAFAVDWTKTSIV